MFQDLTELNCPFPLYGLFEILHQLFLLCLNIWLNGRTTHLHMDTGPQDQLSLSRSKDRQCPNCNPSNRSRERRERGWRVSTLTGTTVLFHNLLAWVMLMIIRQTECQTIVGKAVKHFVLLSAAQAHDLSSQKKHI